MLSTRSQVGYTFALTALILAMAALISMQAASSGLASVCRVVSFLHFHVYLRCHLQAYTSQHLVLLRVGLHATGLLDMLVDALFPTACRGPLSE